LFHYYQAYFIVAENRLLLAVLLV